MFVLWHSKNVGRALETGRFLPTHNSHKSESSWQGLREPKLVKEDITDSSVALFEAPLALSVLAQTGSNFSGKEKTCPFLLFSQWLCHYFFGPDAIGEWVPSSPLDLTWDWRVLSPGQDQALHHTMGFSHSTLCDSFYSPSQSCGLAVFCVTARSDKVLSTEQKPRNGLFIQPQSSSEPQNLHPLQSERPACLATWTSLNQVTEQWLVVWWTKETHTTVGTRWTLCYCHQTLAVICPNLSLRFS